jgi:hypothetical protein
VSAFEPNPPAVTRLRVVVRARPLEKLDLVHAQLNWHVPALFGSFSLVLSGRPIRLRLLRAYAIAIEMFQTRLNNALVKAPSQIVGVAHFGAQTRV